MKSTYSLLNQTIETYHLYFFSLSKTNLIISFLASYPLPFSSTGDILNLMFSGFNSSSGKNSFKVITRLFWNISLFISLIFCFFHFFEPSLSFALPVNFRQSKIHSLTYTFRLSNSTKKNLSSSTNCMSIFVCPQISQKMLQNLLFLFLYHPPEF